ncbi:MAG: hypothetical protein ACI8X3_001852, partial [Saprospiraceae bacterium]
EKELVMCPIKKIKYQSDNKYRVITYENSIQ